MDGLEMMQLLQTLDIESVAEQSVSNNTEIIADLNATQLSQGLNIAGELIGDYKPYKNKAYAEYKNRISPAPGLGNPDLRDTGAFYRALYAAVQGADIEFGSKDEKADKLQKKYSRTPVKGSIFGLTDDSKDELINASLSTSWQKKIIEQTGLSFN